MKNVSAEFKNTIEKRTNFYQTAHIEFTDGSTIDLSKSDFYISGNSYTDSAGGNSFPLGVAMEKQVSISLVNDIDQFSEYDFNMAKITVYCNLDLDSGVTESILMGTYTVTQPEAYGSVVVVDAVDDMYKGDVDYTSNLTFPATLREALADSCSTCGIYLLTSTFANDDFVIQEKPTGITHRAFWGLCSMISGGNARMDEYNRLVISSYNFSLLDRKGAHGGWFDSGNPYSSGDDVYGGDFSPWDSADTVYGGTFTEMGQYHHLWKAKNLTVATDDIIITGIQTTVDEETYLFGKEGYVLSVSNQLIEGNPQDAVDRIGALIVGARFRPFEMDHVAYPLAEFGDVCYLVDRKMNVYQSIITSVNFQYYGFTTLKCTAADPVRNSSKYSGSDVETIVKARAEAKKQVSAYDKSVQMLTSLITQSFGVFKSEEKLADGSTVYYMHDKPELSDSQTIWKMTADAFAVSKDGGQTWNAGMDSEGNAVLNVLSAIGINFEWARGGTLTLGGAENGNGVCIVKDESENVIATLNSDGLTLLKGIMNIGGLFRVDTNGNVVANSLTSNNANITGGRFNVVADDGSYSQISVFHDFGTSGLLNDQCKSIISAAGMRVLFQGSYGLISGEMDGNGFYITEWTGDINDYYSGNGLVSITSTAAALPDTTCKSLSVNGTKNRIVHTDNFGDVLHYCYEMSSPMFGDIGEAKLDDTGLCYIYFDPIFYETISADCKYYVFLQKEGEGDLWVQEKMKDYFLVKGTPGISFSWELKAKQNGYEYERLEVFSKNNEETDINYSAMAAAYLRDYEKEILSYEETN